MRSVWEKLSTDFLNIFIGNTMGFVAPMIVGIIINGQNDVEHWQLVFWISTVVYTVGSLVFIVLGSSEEQKWNRGEISQSQHDNLV